MCWAPCTCAVASLAEAQSAEYQAFAQSLRDMALLEATMQQVAESGQRVLQRLQRAQRRRRCDLASPLNH